MYIKNITMDNLYQPMSQQNKFFYQNTRNQGAPNPENIKQMYTGFNNFQTAYNSLPTIPFNGVQPKSIFSNNGFINDGNLLHNDLYKNVLNEEIREYSVLIDSKDRNYQVYPDPFKYEVKFNPLHSIKERINGKMVTNEVPNPIINESFKNVRYIKLEEIVFPYFYKIKSVNEKMDGEIVQTWAVNTNIKTTDNLYNVLVIDEFKDITSNCRSTNDVLSDSFAAIYFNTQINDTHYVATTSNGYKVFQQDQLYEIKNMHISFIDPYGSPLRCDRLDPLIKSNMECKCDDYNNSTCFRHNLRHPLNPIFQHHLHFKVGVVEPRLSKVTFN